MTAPRTDRRTLLRTAAWTTPAVVAASAAPAHATSTPTLGVSSGATATGAVFTNGSLTWWAPLFAGFTIQPNRTLAANALRVTMTAASPSTDAFMWYTPGNHTQFPAPWTTTDNTGSRLASISFTYPSPVPAGATVPLTDGGLALVCDDETYPIPDATVTVTVTALGMTPVVLTFDGPGMASPAVRPPSPATTSTPLLQR